MRLFVEERDGSIWRRIGSDGVALAVPKGTPQAVLDGWRSRYDTAVAVNSEEALWAVGRDILAWLDQDRALEAWLLSGSRELEVIGGESALSRALLAAPWELLANDAGFLADDRMRHFLPWRRVTPEGTPEVPAHSDLAMLFMAAAPEGQHDLDYEAEEAAILEATRSPANGVPLLHLTVEESGELAMLAARNAEGRFDILHLSCHGDIVKTGANAAPTPILLLESAEGGEDRVAPDRLVAALGQAIPQLLFLSACRTDQVGQEASSAGSLPGRREGVADGPAGFVPAPSRDTGGAVVSPDLSDSLARQMAVHVPHVLGWGGSVYDADAAAYAQALYGGLAQGQNVAYAMASARHAVRDAQANGTPGRHWHLARLYLGPGGGGPLCDRTKPLRPARAEAGRVFLDVGKKVKVASPAEFVGRRRQLQTLRRAFAAGHSGVLVHGLGNLGKSSLAARLADRMTGHRLAVVYGAYHGLAIIAELTRVAKLCLGGLSFAQREAFNAEITAMTQAVGADEGRLFDALRFLLEGVFAAQPILLIIDDLEQALEAPKPHQGLVEPRAETRQALASVLSAFAAAPTLSRLLLTSRYDFALPDAGGRDLAARLVRVPLVPMRPRERQKQWQAKARAEDCDAAGAAAPDLLDRALATAAGNPGLQEILTRPLLAGEVMVAEAAVAAVEHYRATGEHPEEDNAAQEFFARVSFETYEAALTDTERLTLAAATIFEAEVPVPRVAVAAAAKALRVAAPEPALDRLLALGLLDDWGKPAGWVGMERLPHLAANALAYPLAETLPAEIVAATADAALPVLAQVWRDHDGDLPLDSRGVAACRLALVAGAPDLELLEASALAAVLFLFTMNGIAPAALDLACPALERLAAAGHRADPRLLRYVIQAAAQAGEAALQERLLEDALSAEGLDANMRAQLLGLRADRLQVRGELDEALRIRREEQLPVFEALGDQRSAAVTQGRIADVLQVRGELDEALRIRREEQLPVFEALGDQRSAAVTRGRIADVLQARGDLDEALRIRREEELPVFESLGDWREMAVTRGKIADVLQVRGELDEALRIRREEELPVYDALGDRRSAAMTRGKVADVLQVRGELDEALRIRREEELPVYEALGDRRSAAVTWGKIADVLQARGDLDEALRIRREEELPVLEALGDRREMVRTRGKIADVLAAQGDIDGALDLHLSRLPDVRAMNDLSGLVHVRFSCARLRLERGDHRRNGLQTIADELAEAWSGATRMARPDAIGPIGMLYGQVLKARGLPAEASDVLHSAAAAWTRLGAAGQADQCRQIIATIEGTQA